MSTEFLNKTFAYQCSYCGSRFNISLTYLGKIKGAQPINLAICPFCGADVLHRDYKNENVGVVYKGDGFTKQVKNDEG